MNAKSHGHAAGEGMNYEILQGDALQVLKTLPSGIVQTCVTSPPYYGLRDYGHDGQIGLEETPEAYVAKLVEVFREVKRVLHPTGTIWVNLGDSYAGGGGFSPSAPSNATSRAGQRGAETLGIGLGIKPQGSVKAKDLVGIPWMVAFALRADGWYLRSDIIWHKPNPMPESVTDRPTKSHEYIFLLSKCREYFYDADAVREAISQSSIERWGDDPFTKRRPNGLPTQTVIGGETTCGTNPLGRNRRSVWTVATQPYSEAHFATFPPALIEPCILAGSKPGDTVLDPFSGAATSGLVALKHGRKYIGLELNPDYIALSHKRLLGVASQRQLFALDAQEGGA